MTSALTDFQIKVLLFANDGLSNRQIAACTKKSFNCIVTTLSNIKRKGYRLPEHRPLDPTPEMTRKRRDREWQASPAPRFTATGTKLSTGERFTVTSDSLKFAEAHLAAMLGVGDAP